MEPVKPLSDFFDAIQKDCRISITHIGIFAAVLHYRAGKGFINPVEAYRAQVMEIAKISAPQTYNRCMNDLTRYGYLRYVPSFKKNQPSKIYFMEQSV
ncbi:hypothetical protein [Flavobacterium suzhouense]|uniref:Helix-turn-helix domain-containing protein n=1 Tax=Flavobacterium suzhouense TaxID=1529638 RepID=A0ABW5NVG6_9FLAO